MDDVQMKVKIVRIDKSLPLPEYHTSGSVAFDFYTRIDQTFRPGEAKLLPANFIIKVPPGYFLFIASRSSLFKKGLQLANSVGVIDQDYHGPNDELHLSIRNVSERTVEVKKGDRLAQGLILPIQKVAEWQEVEKIKDESRGGYGSTGQ